MAAKSALGQLFFEEALFFALEVCLKVGCCFPVRGWFIGRREREIGRCAIGRMET